MLEMDWLSYRARLILRNAEVSYVIGLEYLCGEMLGKREDWSNIGRVSAMVHNGGTTAR